MHTQSVYVKGIYKAKFTYSRLHIIYICAKRVTTDVLCISQLRTNNLHQFLPTYVRMRTYNSYRLGSVLWQRGSGSSC